MPHQWEAVVRDMAAVTVAIIEAILEAITMVGVLIMVGYITVVYILNTSRAELIIKLTIHDCDTTCCTVVSSEDCVGATVPSIIDREGGTLLASPGSYMGFL